MEEVTNKYPLIIVFYLDSEMMKQRDIIEPFTTSVDKMLNVKKVNAIALFLPTNGEERVECINPVIMKETDMEKVNKIIEDIKKNFVVDIDVPNQEITLDENPCKCGNNSDGECECK